MLTSALRLAIATLLRVTDEKIVSAGVIRHFPSGRLPDSRSADYLSADRSVHHLTAPRKINSTH